FLGLNLLDYYKPDLKEGGRYNISISQLARMKPDTNFCREKIATIHRQFDIGYVPSSLQINNIMLLTTNYCVESIRNAIKNTTDSELAKNIPDEIYTTPMLKGSHTDSLFVRSNIQLADTVHEYLLSQPSAVAR